MAVPSQPVHRVQPKETAAEIFPKLTAGVQQKKHAMPGRGAPPAVDDYPNSDILRETTKHVLGEYHSGLQQLLDVRCECFNCTQVMRHGVFVHFNTIWGVYNSVMWFP
jgi:hypothetical protein